MDEDLTKLSDEELESQTMNCDAADQDEIASDLFIEIWRRYNNKKYECQSLEETNESLRDDVVQARWDRSSNYQNS